MLTVTLGVLVWKKLITLEQANKLHKELGNRKAPETVEQVIKELEEASK